MRKCTITNIIAIKAITAIHFPLSVVHRLSNLFTLPGGWWLVVDANLIIDLTNQADQLKVVVIVVIVLAVVVSLIYLEANRVNLFESRKGGHHIR